ncbi:hypothetical protein WN51_05026 [Melipona quadrifasciata]|uniref:Uncharacterized protein n=1 Tax=Melipona quadrifasciata TaxID=166423 RepID=A0A0N0BD84_9HYME|nr:hypothetical protein WN51_05026 [Melipona quadrifasciata]
MGVEEEEEQEDRLHLTRLRAENDACFANWARVLALERNQRNSSGLPAASDSAVMVRTLAWERCKVLQLV